MPKLLLRTYFGIKILQIHTGGSFLLKIHVIMPNYEMLRVKRFILNLLQSFLKIKLKVYSQFLSTKKESKNRKESKMCNSA